MMTLAKTMSPYQVEQLVFHEYDLYPYQIENFGRVRKISCNRGLFALKDNNLDPEKMDFLINLFSHLHQQQFAAYVPFVPNKYGDPYIHLQEHSYYLTRWIDDRVEAKYQVEWESQVLQLLGQLHRVTESFAAQELQEKDRFRDGQEQTLGQHEHHEQGQLQHQQKEHDLQHLTPLFGVQVIVKRWKERLEQMGMYRDMAEERSLMSPLETAFVSHYEDLKTLGERAIYYLQKWLATIESSTDIRTVVCHGHIHRQHIVHDQNQLYFLNYDHACVDFPARELALFFRRHMDPTAEWEVHTGVKWLEAYEEEFPLNQDEKRLLGIMLLFPEKVFKEVERYYAGEANTHPLPVERYFEKQVVLSKLLRYFVRKIVGRDAFFDQLI